MDEKSPRLAMLIDGDNISHKAIKAIVDEASKHGSLPIRRVYGDWTKQNLVSWKEAANLNAIQQVQQSNYTSGKNSTDGALIIDAMDLLYTANLDGFCIVSSDSDYTRLAIRMREHGRFVLGIGGRNTPPALVNACHLFTHIETITGNGAPALVGTAPALDSGNDGNWTEQVTRAIEELKGEDEWVLLSPVGHRLRTTNPAFDHRSYGFKNLHSMIASESEKFNIKPNELDGVVSGHFVRLKPHE